jgi:hypothetical protein
MDSIFDAIDTHRTESINFEQFRGFFTQIYRLKEAIGEKRSLSHDEGRSTRLREDSEGPTARNISVALVFTAIYSSKLSLNFYF